MKNTVSTSPRLGLYALLLTGSVVFAGDPIVFIRTSGSAPPLSQVPPKQVDSKIVTALDSLDAPSPANSALSVPAGGGERPRTGREPLSRRSEMARKERENWIWYDKGDLQEEEASGATYEIEEDPGLPGEANSSRRAGLRQSSGERRADDREARVPTHLQSPQTRQRIQSEAVAMHRLQSQAQDGDLESAQRLDLARMLTPGPEATSNERLRELLGGSSESAPRAAMFPSGVGQLGSAGGSELTTRSVVSPLKLGADFERYSFMDRGTSPEIPPGINVSGPPSTFNGYRSSFREFLRLPSEEGAGSAGVAPGTPMGAYPRGIEVPDYAPPRRGGTLGR